MVLSTRKPIHGLRYSANNNIQKKECDKNENQKNYFNGTYVCNAYYFKY